MEFASAYGAVYSRRAEVVAGRARDVDGKRTGKDPPFLCIRCAGGGGDGGGGRIP